MEWQPIETAPKDGTWICLWRGKSPSYGKWSPFVIARWDEAEEAFAWPDDGVDPWFDAERADERIEAGDNFASDQFTHWMPLPSPPVQP